MKFKISQTKLTLLLAVFFTVFYNFSFFKKTTDVYPIHQGNFFYLASLSVALMAATNLFLSLIRIRKIYKGLFLGILFLSAMAAYVMDSFGVVVDELMFLNIIHTDAKESLDLFTFKLCFYMLFLFFIPGFLLCKVKIEELSLKTEIFSRIKSIIISIIIVFIMIISCGKFYASFFREQKPLRYYTNPTYWIYSMGKFGSSAFKNPNRALRELGRNSKVPTSDTDRDLVILVVGETARKDRFSLNGYSKKTNPFTEKENVVSFTNVTSCGTSTAISVPCMFSHFGRNNFSVDDANSTENLLDVLSHTKDINVLWRDNNSDSKGVAIRAKFEDYKSSATNTICDAECRDIGMLVGLQEYINNVKEKDIVIVLHQMGNHGPAYYKRYPPEFEVFKPVCRTSEFSKCTNEEIGNAYDNAIRYTDFFLSKVIALLRHNSVNFNTGMLYISDHGESLGENGIYLHGLPYMMAPKEQKEVALLMWFGGMMEKETNYVLLKKALNNPYSHDNIFHTILGMLDIESSAYDPKLDILHGIHTQSRLFKP